MDQPHAATAADPGAADQAAPDGRADDRPLEERRAAGVQLVKVQVRCQSRIGGPAVAAHAALHDILGRSASRARLGGRATRESTFDCCDQLCGWQTERGSALEQHGQRGLTLAPFQLSVLTLVEN